MVDLVFELDLIRRGKTGSRMGKPVQPILGWARVFSDLGMCGCRNSGGGEKKSLYLFGHK